MADTHVADTLMTDTLMTDTQGNEGRRPAVASMASMAERFLAYVKRLCPYST